MLQVDSIGDEHQQVTRDTSAALTSSVRSEKPSAVIIPINARVEAKLEQEKRLAAFDGAYGDDEGDWTNREPPDALPLDASCREDFDGMGILDHPGAFSRVFFGELVNAYDFRSECMEVFGVTHLDDDLEDALLEALNHFTCMVRDPAATVCGLFVGSLHVFMRHHRAFRRNINGPKRPWPRKPHEIRAEMRKALPHALRCLEDELRDALAGADGLEP